jgi:hypothetical protein
MITRVDTDLVERNERRPGSHVGGLGARVYAAFGGGIDLSLFDLLCLMRIRSHGR